MNLFSLILYGGINLLMVLWYLRGRGRFYQFPFWAGVLALGWFFPQAVGGYFTVKQFPEGAYAVAMLFASICTLALWFGFSTAFRKRPRRASWLAMPFNPRRLYYTSVVFCCIGFFFQWKLWSLPEEMLAQTQWSGATVKYLFLASVFKFGFITLWLLYLTQRKWTSFRFLIFIIPCLFLLLDAAFLRGRRAEMMNLVSYLLISLWLVRRITVPRAAVLSLLAGGILLVNGVGIYRSIMMNRDIKLKERVSNVVKADYFSASENSLEQSGNEFKNYIFRRLACAEGFYYDFGASHWNQVVFNYVPAQIIGEQVKASLMLPLADVREVVEAKYGFSWHTGTTATGYADAFESFGWLGFVKFFLVGWIMGVLYRYALGGTFLGQFLYVYVLATAMQAISHGTNDILIRIWIYFFVLGFPFFYWAKARMPRNAISYRR